MAYQSNCVEAVSKYAARPYNNYSCAIFNDDSSYFIHFQAECEALINLDATPCVELLDMPIRLKGGKLTNSEEAVECIVKLAEVTGDTSY